MNQRQPRNLAASIRQRLLQLARARREEFQLTLTRYGLERTLYRLGRSAQRDQFILKGALLFSLWSDDFYRPTRDLDLLGHGSSDIPRLEQLFCEIIATPVEDDGLVYLVESVKGDRIRQDEEYEGVHIQIAARLDNARISIKIDIGFGDVITPSPQEIEYPTMLDLPKPRLRAYPRETVIAEKFEAMVKLGIGNTRLKDFHDLMVLSRQFEFDGDLLSQAIKATFARRGTPLPAEAPIALTNAFFNDASKQVQWRAFMERMNLKVEGMSLEEVVTVLRNFLMPPTLAARQKVPFKPRWSAVTSWK